MASESRYLQSEAGQVRAARRSLSAGRVLKVGAASAVLISAFAWIVCFIQVRADTAVDVDLGIAPSRLATVDQVLWAAAGALGVALVAFPLVFISALACWAVHAVSAHRTCSQFSLRTLLIFVAVVSVILAANRVVVIIAGRERLIDGYCFLAYLILPVLLGLIAIGAWMGLDALVSWFSTTARRYLRPANDVTYNSANTGQPQSAASRHQPSADG